MEDHLLDRLKGEKEGSGTERGHWLVLLLQELLRVLPLTPLFARHTYAKAMFGDVNTHQTSVLPQAESYVHRFVRMHLCDTRLNPGRSVVPSARAISQCRFCYLFGLLQGPGLVLYWFGHAPLNRLSDAQGDIAIFGWDVPDKFMLPTGELLTHANGGA